MDRGFFLGVRFPLLIKKEKKLVPRNSSLSTGGPGPRPCPWVITYGSILGEPYMSGYPLLALALRFGGGGFLPARGPRLERRAALRGGRGAAGARSPGAVGGAAGLAAGAAEPRHPGDFAAFYQGMVGRFSFFFCQLMGFPY